MKAGQCYVVLIGGWNQHVDLVKEWERMHHWLFGGRQMQGISVHLRLYSWLGLIQTSLKDRKRRKMKPTALSGSYPPRIHFMEYYETCTEVFVLWFKLEVTGIVVSRKWADFVQFLLWTIHISACEHRGIFMLFLVWLGFIFKQQNLRMIWILCNSE